MTKTEEITRRKRTSSKERVFFCSISPTNCDLDKRINERNYQQ